MIALDARQGQLRTQRLEHESLLDALSRRLRIKMFRTVAHVPLQHPHARWLNRLLDHGNR
jgi:hypothetical protein